METNLNMRLIAESGSVISSCFEAMNAYEKNDKVTMEEKMLEAKDILNLAMQTEANVRKMNSDFDKMDSDLLTTQAQTYLHLANMQLMNTETFLRLLKR